MAHEFTHVKAKHNSKPTITRHGLSEHATTCLSEEQQAPFHSIAYSLHGYSINATIFF